MRHVALRSGLLRAGHWCIKLALIVFLLLAPSASCWKKQGKKDRGLEAPTLPATDPMCAGYLAPRHGLPPEAHHTYQRLSGLTVFQSINKIKINAGTLKSLTPDDPRPPCTPQQLMGVNATAGAFHFTPQGTQKHLVYEPQACLLRRLTAPAARRCLAGKYVAFIGDSLSRYQYLTLAYFLAHMKQLPRYHGRKAPHLVVSGDWPDWQEYFHRGSSLLSMDAVKASVHEECDCYRRNNGTVPGLGYGIREFRRFCLSPGEVGRGCEDGHPLEAGQVKLGFHSALGYPSYDRAVANALADVLSEASPPDVVYVNTGLWIPAETPVGGLRAAFEGVMEAAAELTRAQAQRAAGDAAAFAGAIPKYTTSTLFRALGWETAAGPGGSGSGSGSSGSSSSSDGGGGSEHTFGVQRLGSGKVTRVVWKTTTRRRRPQDMEVLANAAALDAAAKAGLPVYDVRAMGESAAAQNFTSKAMYMDGRTHYWAYIYQEFNDVLLNTLCDERCGWAPDSWGAAGSQRAA